MEVLICIIGIFGGLWLWLRHNRSSVQSRLLDAGALRMPLSEETAKLEYLGLASIGPIMFENQVRARLDKTGIWVSLQGAEEELFLPLGLVTVIEAKLTTVPLRFGSGLKTVELNFWDAVSVDAVRKVKATENLQTTSAIVDAIRDAP